MKLFGKKSDDDGADAANRDPSKANRFFEHAETVADARNYDYAIECYINGLQHDPDNMSRHEELYEVAKRRKVGGGKPAGMKEKINLSSKDAIDKMLHAETLWAKDPLNLKRMIDVMSRAVDAEQAFGDYNFAEVAYWVGNMIIEAGQTDKPPTKSDFLKVRDLFIAIDAYQKAVDACRLATDLDPTDSDLFNELKDLEAELTMHSGYVEATASEEKDSYKKVIKDADKQAALQQESGVVQTEQALDETIERRRAAWEEEPEDLDLLQKLVATLIQRETEETETEALELLEKAREESGQYKYKLQSDDLRIKRMNRDLRKAKKKVEDIGGDKAREEWKELAQKKLSFELETYTERVQEYPTDLKHKYELGKRLLAFKKIDKAIGMFQQAKEDPNQRSAANEYLGRCYLAKDWVDEAIQTLREGIERHPTRTDKRAKEMRYLLLGALERKAEEDSSLEHAEKAQEVASELLQTDIQFRDIQERMEKTRNLVKQLRDG
ncbi:MAG: hypothetical protein R3336_01365 [Phycisphaeraceae bacterium]|nr:hypothetical protein [Phycisphaeraceae bacterium]